jgi:hypothetical protein
MDNEPMSAKPREDCTSGDTHAYVSEHVPDHSVYWVRQCMLCHAVDWDHLDFEVAKFVNSLPPKYLLVSIVEGDFTVSDPLLPGHHAAGISEQTKQFIDRVKSKLNPEAQVYVDVLVEIIGHDLTNPAESDMLKAEGGENDPNA